MCDDLIRIVLFFLTNLGLISNMIDRKKDQNIILLEGTTFLSIFGVGIKLILYLFDSIKNLKIALLKN